jgi:hypothetical protein
MTEQPAPETSPSEDAARNYLLVGLTALVIMLLVLLRRGLGGLSLLPVIVGLLGLTLHWRIVPPVLLLLLACLVFFAERTDQFGTFPSQGGQSRDYNVADWILSAAVLAYFGAYYRILGLTASLFPHDVRHRGSAAEGQPTSDRPRTIRTASPAEVGWLVLGLPLWAFVAQICWRLLPVEAESNEPSSNTWIGIAVAWIIGIGLFLAAGLFGHIGRRRLKRSEALLFLQDALWEETRRDQRRVNHWLAWLDRRRRLRKEQS